MSRRFSIIVTVVISAILLGLTAVFWQSYVRFAESCRDFGLSVAYYFCELFGIDYSFTPTVTEYSGVLQWEILLPADWDGFTAAAKQYFSLLIDGENFAGYWAVVGNVMLVAVMLIVGGVFMLFCDRIFNKGTDATPLTYKRSFVIGLVQCISMIPGVSRSMATIVGGMSQRLTRKAAAEFSFFLAVPTMLGATCLELYKMISHGEGNILMEGNNLEILIIGSVVAFFVAIAAIKFFISYVTKYGFKMFGWYRIIVGGLIVALSLAGYELTMVG